MKFVKIIAAIAVSMALASGSFAAWTGAGWSGAIDAGWLNWANDAAVGDASAIPASLRLKSVMGVPEFAAVDIVTKFHILTTYFGNGYEDDSHAIRGAIAQYMAGSSVDAEQFRALTGNGDVGRVGMAVKSLLRYAKEMFVEKDLTENMRANSLYIFFLSYGSAETLNTDGTAFADNVFGGVGGALASMRQVRTALIDAATIQNKVILAQAGQSFVGEGKLVLANNLVDALNSGTGIVEALTALGVAIDGTTYDARKSAALAIKADIESGGLVNEPRLTLLEIYLGVDGFNTFVDAYNAVNP